MTNLTDIMDETATYERRQIVELLAPLQVAREESRVAGKRASDLGDRVKNWMLLEGENEVTDDERGIRVFLQSTTETTWDIEHMREEVVLELAKRGLLTVNTRAFDALKRTATNSLMDEADRFRMRGEGSPRLMVESKS